MVCPAIMLVAEVQESFYISPNSCEVAIVRFPNPAYVPDRCQTIEELREREVPVLKAISENSSAMGVSQSASSGAKRYILRGNLKRLLPSHVHLAQVNTVEKRNARERTRVNTVNQAFLYLKKILPSLRANTKRVSKLKILRAAISYISLLDKVDMDRGHFSLTNYCNSDAGLAASSPLKNSAVDVSDMTQPMFPQHQQTDGADNQSTRTYTIFDDRV